MSIARIALAAVAAVAVVGAADAAPPKPFKNEDSWPKAKVGGKTCMITHAHNGFSPSWPSLKGAKAYAVREWVAHTKWEYGAPWASYRLAIRKKMDCTSSGGRYTCVVYGNPCRR